MDEGQVAQQIIIRPMRDGESHCAPHGMAAALAVVGAVSVPIGRVPHADELGENLGRTHLRHGGRSEPNDRRHEGTRSVRMPSRTLSALCSLLSVSPHVLILSPDNPFQPSSPTTSGLSAPPAASIPSPLLLINDDNLPSSSLLFSLLFSSPLLPISPPCLPEALPRLSPPSSSHSGGGPRKIVEGRHRRNISCRVATSRRN